MPHARQRPRLKEWTVDEIKLLKSLAGAETVAVIAHRLKRTEGAVRQKAMLYGISLASRPVVVSS